ncbi:hypothetical protein HYW61_00735 [candidate division WWE3 bacterium]|nr:hypothetical protein [candidate division WWE3 bacterium]
MTKNQLIISPISYFLFGTAGLLSLYLSLMWIATKSFGATLDQFDYYKPWILTLAVGFGVQLALYRILKLKSTASVVAGSAVRVTGVTSTATMVACCAHHLTDVLPIIGISTLASFFGVYAREIFLAGIVFNSIGIFYMVRLLRRYTHV